MAWTAAVTATERLGDKLLVSGTFSNTAGTTGGAIVTGGSAIWHFGAGATGGTGAITRSTTDYTVSGGSATIITGTTTNGTWFALVSV